MDIHESGEDYLETILMLEQRIGSVRAIDIATEMGYSKPTISIAMRRLRENGYIENDDKKDIRLTERGKEVAERMYERHVFLTELFSKIGVDSTTAVHEACKIEHDISEDTFRKLKSFYEQLKVCGGPQGKSVVQSLIERRSIKKYKPEQITDEQLEAVLTAGTYAPTAMGLQSPQIVVTQKPEDVAELSRLNAAVIGKDLDPFYGAPTVITVFAERGKATGIQDASLVLGNMLNAAYSVGLGSCWINRAKELFESEEGKAILKRWGLDEDKWVGVGHCILGYADHSPVAKPRREGYVLRIE
ncbi:MAG: nitroreductase family protein [Oscillospiraceae bacterium]